MSRSDIALAATAALGLVILNAHACIGAVTAQPETPVDKAAGERVEWRTAPDEYMRLVVGGVVRMTVDDQMRVTCHGVGGRSLEVINGKAVCHVK